MIETNDRMMSRLVVTHTWKREKERERVYVCVWRMEER